MKHFFLLVFLFGFLAVHGQGTLQFNQVLKITDQAQTVPAGKIWKVVSYWQGNLNVTANTQTNCANSSRHTPFILDGELYFLFRNVSTGSSNFLIAPSNELPIWLAAGSTLQTQCSKDFLSVIEFNLVP